MTLSVIRAGRVEFDVAWAYQRELADSVRLDSSRAFLLLLEHPPVFTLGKNAKAENVLNPAGIPVKRIDRGGDVTYHGPGQLVGYPILSLRERKLGVRSYVERVEEALVATLADFGIEAKTKPGCVGVWTSRGKIASLGVRVARGVTLHGFALNVSTDLTPFSFINPCGVAGSAVSSMEGELGRRIPVELSADKFVPHFARIFRFPDVVSARPNFACGAPDRSPFMVGPVRKNKEPGTKNRGVGGCLPRTPS